MDQPLVLSIDAMGGDFGPPVTVEGMALAARASRRPLRFLAHGDQTAIEAELARFPDLKAKLEIRHTDSVISGDVKPAQALRRGKGTSLWNAVESVRVHQAAGALSGGNTGALMAISKLHLRMIGGLDRPAIVASWPTSKGMKAVLDVGANIDCDADQLLEFAVMGSAFWGAVHGAGKRPTVGLLNVGSEEMKGHQEVRDAHQILRLGGLDFDYHGFVEGNDIALGTVDVVVTDGFTGNVALKTGEGMARFFGGTLRAALSATIATKLGALIASSALRSLKARLDPSTVNGGPLLGLKGTVVKSHGSADARGFANAIGVAADLAASSYADEIARNMDRLVAIKAAATSEPRGEAQSAEA